MDKSNRNVLYILVIISLILGAYLVFGNVLNTAFASGTLKCSILTPTSVACTSSSNSYQTTNGNSITLTFASNPGINDALIGAWRKSNSTVNEFFSNAVACGGTTGVTYYNINQDSKYNFIADPRTNSVIAAQNCGANYYRYYLTTVNGIFSGKKQLLVVSGTVTDNQGISTPFVTYALCYVSYNGGSCSLNIPETYQGEYTMTPTSMVFYADVNGFNDSSVCVQSGIEKCDGTTLSVCNTNSFSFISQGQVSGKCGYSGSNTPPVNTNPTNTNTTQNTSCIVNNSCTTQNTSFVLTPQLIIYAIIGIIIIGGVIVYFVRRR